MNITLTLHVVLFRPTNPILAKTAILGICWLAVIGYSGIVIAAEWSLEPSIDLAIGVDDNATFSEEDGFCVNEVEGCDD